MSWNDPWSLHLAFIYTSSSTRVSKTEAYPFSFFDSIKIMKCDVQNYVEKVHSLREARWIVHLTELKFKYSYR